MSEVELLGALLAAVSILAAALGLPVPTMPALIYAGSLIAQSTQPLAVTALTLATSMVGGLLGDTAWYHAGRRFGFRVLRVLCRMSLSRDTCVRRTESFFERRGVRILLFARFVPGLAVVSVPMTGTAAVSYGRFALHDALGVLLWTAFGLLLGFAVADQVDMIVGLLQQFGFGITGGALLILAGFAAFRWYRRQRLLRDLEMSRTSVEELHQLMQSEMPPVVADVRSRDGRRGDPFVIPGAVLLDVDALEQQVADIPRSATLVLYCACPNEITAAMMAKRLRGLGFQEVRPLLGGLDAWRDSGQQVDALRDRTGAAPAPGTVEAEGSPVLATQH